MAWLEMSRTPESRPPGWRVGECLWSPRKNEIGRPWAFWETMRDVQIGDVVFHLCGRSNKAAFAGFSIAASDCLSIDEGPFGPDELYRVELSEYEPLPKPLLLSDVFASNDQALREYFSKNRMADGGKERLFYVLQAGRLQCLNGAYLSFLSDRLLAWLFGIDAEISQSSSRAISRKTRTGMVLGEAARRVGQQGFSRNVKENYGYCCCFPDCDVNDRRFLVGSHIARWADNEDLRGETANGLCLCLLHDKAFEVGAFTFDADLRVLLGSSTLGVGSWLHDMLALAAGRHIRPASIAPSLGALVHHWRSHGYQIGVGAQLQVNSINAQT